MLVFGEECGFGIDPQNVWCPPPPPVALWNQRGPRLVLQGANYIVLVASHITWKPLCFEFPFAVMFNKKYGDLWRGGSYQTDETITAFDLPLKGQGLLVLIVENQSPGVSSTYAGLVPTRTGLACGSCCDSQLTFGPHTVRVACPLCGASSQGRGPRTNTYVTYAIVLFKGRPLLIYAKKED